MSVYKFGGYKLTMLDTGKVNGYGKAIVKYCLKNPSGIKLFAGQDFAASPMDTPTGKQSACALIQFLTLKPGDTDADYFEHYTDNQMEFAQGEAEQIGYAWRERLGDKDL